MDTKVILTTVLFLVNSVASASTLFFDDFESGLGLWNDAHNGNNAQIVVDPLDSGNKVLNFTALVGGGDLFTAASYSSSTGNDYILSFDYLGTCGSSNCGGFIGHSSNTTGSSQTWLEGTADGGGIYSDILPDTGSWEQVTIPFSTGAGPIHLMLEDWIGSGGIAGDAYFDNILLTDLDGPSAVPVPAAALLFTPALLGFLGLRRMSKL